MSDPMLTVLLMFAVPMVAWFAAPLMGFFSRIVGAWCDHMHGRLVIAAERFCRRRGWY